MPSGSGKPSKGGAKKAASRELLECKSKLMDAKDKNKTLVQNNITLVATVNQLNLDIGELRSELDAERKKKGTAAGGAATDTVQLKLVDGMQSSVRNLVQQKFFVKFPFLDKITFSQANLIIPAGAYLGFADGESQKYAVDIRRVCITKTTYWRGYCGDQVKKEYISKSLTVATAMLNKFSTND